MLTTETWCPEFVGEGRIRYYSLARHALIDALRSAGVKAGNRVLLPQFLCRDLLASLHFLGAVPIWYEVALDLTPAAEPENWPAADVVLAVNYFGFPQDLRPFQSYAQRTGAVVIEDNAHGYMSRDRDGRWLGCRTGLGIFSLRKTLRIPDGAALWIGASHAVHALPAQSAFDGLGVNPAQLTKARLRGLPLVGEWAYRVSTAGARVLRKWRTGSVFPAVDLNSEKSLPAPANPWVGLLPVLAACPVSTEVERRRALYASCAQVGERLGVVPVFAVLPPNCAPYAYAFRGSDMALAGMRRYATRHGFDLVNWPDLPAEIVGHAPSHYRNVFLVNFQW